MPYGTGTVSTPPVVPRIAIVGGGASGALVATRLLRSATHPLDIVLVDREPTPGRGVAYGTAHPWHLLNVRSCRMSAFPEEPDHFVGWLRQNGYAVGRNDFAPRLVYGAYLADVLARAERSAAAGVRFRHWRDLVVDADVDVDDPARPVTLTLVEHGPLVADHVVLALGNGRPSDPCRVDRALVDAGRWCADPWAFTLPSDPDATVALVGSGLTAVDVVLSLRHRGHRGAIVIVSRHGELPSRHHLGSTVLLPAALQSDPPKRLQPLVAAVRAHVAEQVASGVAWQDAFDALRPWTTSLWRSLSESDQRRFLRLLRHRWDHLRHRAPESAADELTAEIERGGVELVAGRVLGVSVAPGGIGLDIATRAGERVTIEAAIAVNCTGPNPNPCAWGSPLVHGLEAAGVLRAHPLGLGLAVDAAGHLVGASGEVDRRFVTLGPALQGDRWEATAMPEIRVQAAAIADGLLGDLAVVR